MLRQAGANKWLERTAEAVTRRLQGGAQAARHLAPPLSHTVMRVNTEGISDEEYSNAAIGAQDWRQWSLS